MAYPIYIYICMYVYEQINKCETQINYKKKKMKNENSFVEVHVYSTISEQ